MGLDEKKYQHARQWGNEYMQAMSPEAAENLGTQSRAWLEAQGIFRFVPDEQGLFGFRVEPGQAMIDLAAKDGISLLEAGERLLRTAAVKHEQANPELWKEIEEQKP